MLLYTVRKKNIIEEIQIKAFIRLVINVDPKNTNKSPITMKKAPSNGLKKSTDYLPGIIKSLHASGPEI